MELTRRDTVTLGVATMLATAARARAAEPDTLVSGDNLPQNLDPHQVFDVPMQALDAEHLRQAVPLRGQSARRCVPWLADSHTVSADGLTWEFKLRPGMRSSTMAARSPPTDVVYSFQRVLAPGHGARRRVPADPEARQRHRARRD